MDFLNKVVIIIGASSGIGSGAAEYFSQLNAKVVLVGRNEDGLKGTASKCICDTLIIQADITKEEDRLKIIEETLEKFDKINVLINNAGQGYCAKLIDTPLEVFDNLMNINVRSIFHLTQLAIPHLIKTEGNIVNVSSGVTLRNFDSMGAYAMTKGALDLFTKYLAYELGEKRVRVNSINPGCIKTNILNNLGFTEEDKQNFYENFEQIHALGRVGVVSETAHVIAFLASDLASFITGTCLPVEGGLIQMPPGPRK